MNIFLLTETKSGCYKWRAAIPAKYLALRGHQVQVFSADLSSHQVPDVMVFYRAHYPEAVRLMEWCKRNRIRVVFDTDDALDLVPPENLNYSAVQQRLSLYQVLLAASDVVTTTTEELAVHLRRSNPNVVVVPNSVDPEEWAIQPRKDHTRIGWTGSPTHFADLTVVFDAIRELQKEHDFRLVLQGICAEPTLDELYETLLALHGKKFLETPLGRAIKHFMAKLSGIRYEFHPTVPIEEHARKVSGLALDIGIAPLVDNLFNRHKSCIKYYEYAMSGAVTVASHVLPYSSEVSITAKNNRESWKRSLASILEGDRDLMWRQQRDWVLAHRNIETNVGLWERVLDGDTAPRRESPEAEPFPTHDRQESVDAAGALTGERVLT